MFFFPPDPPQDGDSAPQQHLSPPWWQPPEDEFPLLFPIAERLATGENAAIFVREARVYSIGVEVVIDRRMRRGELSERDWQLLQWGGQPFFGGQDPERVRYRNRRENVDRKSGNIADFCRRWGSVYPYMIVFDADSVMSGEALVRMVKLMERHPEAGIIQVPPMPGRSFMKL